LGLIYGYLNDLPRALEVASQARDRADALAGRPHSSPSHEGLIGHLYCLQGDFAAARATLAPILSRYDQAALKQQFVMVYYTIALLEAHLALADGRPEAAGALAGEALGHLRANAVRIFAVDALHLQGRSLRVAGRLDAAQAVLEAARAEAEAVGSRRTLWLIQAELAALAEARGDFVAAQALWEAAGRVIDYIATHTGSPERAASFLSRADVRAVLAREMP
jgi:hypothetical protein